MKIIISCVICVISFLQLQAQVENEFYMLHMRGDSLRKVGNFTGAISIYQKLAHRYPGEQKVFATYKIAQCLEKQGKWPAAKKQYLSLLEIPAKASWRWNHKSFAVSKLYDSAVSQHQYREALMYLRWLNGKHRYIPMCGMGGYESRIEMHYQFFSVFEKLGQIDSALHYFTPYVFEQNNLGIDSIDYQKMVDHYYSVLLKKYEACEVADLLASSMRDIKYVLAPAQFGWSLDCSFKALGSTIYINSPDWSFSNKGDFEHGNFRKENLVKMFKSSYGYRLLMREVGVSKYL